MKRLFENMTDAITEGVRKSLGLGIDGDEKLMILAEDVDVEIAGQKRDDVDIKLIGAAKVDWDLVDSELIIKAVRDSETNIKPIIRVYLPINAGIAEMAVDTWNGDITVDSVVKRAFINYACLTARAGDIELGGRNIIKAADVYALSGGFVAVKYDKIQSDIEMNVTSDDASILENWDDADDDGGEVTLTTSKGYDVIVEWNEIC